MPRFGAALALLFALTGWGRAASPNPDDLAVPAEVWVKSRALVRQLGSEDFAEREEAQEKLAALGRLARPALLAGVTADPDPEVRLRCAELLPKATALDLKAKLDTFLADTNGEYEHDLPGWKTFRTVVGAEWSVFGRLVWRDRELDRAAREVFAELIAAPANRRLLQSIDGSRLVLSELAVARRQDLYSRRYPRDADATTQTPTLDEVATLLFAEGRVGSQYLPRRGTVSGLLSGSGFTAAARGPDPKARVYRALAVAWLDSRNEPREMYQALNIASSLDLPDQVCGLAARLLAMPGVTTLNRSRAASYLVDYGGPRHVRLLAKALTDPFVVESIRTAMPGEAELVAHDIQVRDLALVVALALTGQKPADYDLADRFAGNPTADNPSFTSRRYYFPDDDARKRGFAKWEKWRKAQAHADP